VQCDIVKVVTNEIGRLDMAQNSGDYFGFGPGFSVWDSSRASFRLMYQILAPCRLASMRPALAQRCNVVLEIPVAAETYRTVCSPAGGSGGMVTDPFLHRFLWCLTSATLT